MKVIHYGQDKLITGDDIADALVRYAEFLAMADLAATIDIPVLDADGKVVMASVLLGPASQIVALSKDTDASEIVDEELVANLAVRTKKIGPAKAIPSESPEDQSLARFVDDL